MSKVVDVGLCESCTRPGMDPGFFIQRGLIGGTNFWSGGGREEG